MIPINEVRNTVMFFLNKSNKGYITPDEFNLFSQMAQNEIFNSMFGIYNDSLIKRDKRLTNSEYGDLPAFLEESIDLFSVYTTPANFTYDPGTKLWSYTGNDLYSTESLSLVNAQNKKVNIEIVGKSELNYLINSNMNAPTLTYPVYVKIGDRYQIYPEVPAGYSPEMFFIRKPKSPKWTFINVSGNPIFNPSAGDLQNFEIDYTYMPELIVKILLYCGVAIREEMIVQDATNDEIRRAQMNA